MAAVPPEPVPESVPEAEPVSQLHPSDTVAAPQPPATVRRSEFDFLSPPRSTDELGRLGEYRVLGVLGKGGMGAVFRAHDPSLNRDVALKVMQPKHAANPDARKRFLREAKAQAAVEHDHIIPIFQVGEDRGTPFIVMPLLKGMTLGAALKANPTVPIPEVIRIGREMAEGLGAAHARGLIHRDIKPSNVWLEGKRLRVKILDFGLARVDQVSMLDGGGEQLTALGAVLGTPQYMSPEQARGEELDHRSDLFSLGVVLYQMSTGRLPFTGDSAHAAVLALALEAPVPADAVNSSLPGELNDFIMRLLAKDPVDRPMSADEVVEDLARVGKPVRAFVPVPVDDKESDDPWRELGFNEPSVGRTRGPNTTRTPRRKSAGIPSWVWLALAVIPLLGLGLGMIRLLAPKGTLVIESDVAGAVLIVTDEHGVARRLEAGEIVLPPGEYSAELLETSDRLRVDPERFRISDGDRVRVSVGRVKKASSGVKPTPAPGPWRELFDGKDLAEWVVNRGGYSIENLDGGPVFRLARETKLTSIDSFGDYHLSLQFRQVPDLSVGHLAYHINGQDGLNFALAQNIWGKLHVWSDRTTCLAGELRDGRVIPNLDLGIGQAYPGSGARNRFDGWTWLDLVCVGDTSIHLINGEVVCVAANLRLNDTPLTQGQLMFQIANEGDFIGRALRIRSVAELPEEFDGSKAVSR